MIGNPELNPVRSKAAHMLRNQECAATAEDPKKHASVKGSKYPKKSRMCCLCRIPVEARLGQRQQISEEVKNVLPLSKTRRSTPRSKAANIRRNQECAASAEDPKNLASVKGNKYPKKSRMCCLCRSLEKARLGQRQHIC